MNTEFSNVYDDKERASAYAGWRAGLVPVTIHGPLARPSEPYAWVSETTISPWGIYVLRRGE